MKTALFLVLVIAVMAMGCGEESIVSVPSPTTIEFPDSWAADVAVTTGNAMARIGNSTTTAYWGDDITGGTGHVPSTFDPPTYEREWRVETPMGLFYTNILPHEDSHRPCVEIRQAVQVIEVDPYLTNAASGGWYNISREYREVELITICGDYQLYHKDNASYWN